MNPEDAAEYISIDEVLELRRDVERTDTPIESATVLVPSVRNIRTKPPDPHQRAASRLAIGLLLLFGATLFFVLYEGFGVLQSAPFADPLELMSKGVVPFLEKAGSFAQTVFGPLLAFVLGYYFGTEKKHD